MGIEYGYAGHIVKSVPQADGSLMVYGVATDPGVDLDGQGCDPEWLKQAMPEWFKSAANIREQHGPTAAGVGKELERADGDVWKLKAHIVDPGTVAKVNAGVLKGFSIGVRNGKVARDKAAGFPNGKIVDGKIVEISLVDRPCNPRATMTIVKAAAGGELEMLETPEEVDIDPSMFIGENDDADHDDESAERDEDEQDSQAVDGAVDDGPGLSLFDEIAADMDPPYAWGPDDDLDDMLDTVALTDEPALIEKGLLEQLVRGPAKKDGDGDGRTGEGDERSKEAERRRRLKAQRDKEREDARKHRDAMDAERAADSHRAQRQGRQLEASEHRNRMGHYDKAEMTAREYRDAVRLAHQVNDGTILKAQFGVTDTDVYDTLAGLVTHELDGLVEDAELGVADPSALLAAVGAIVKFLGLDGDVATILKAAGSELDESSAGATLDVAEIVKAQVAEQLSAVQEAHKAEVATLRAQVTKMAATPLPGGPVVSKFAVSAPAHIPAQPAADSPDYWRELAANPNLSSEVRDGYLAKAAEVGSRRG